jgi:hypothetical protein
MKYDCDRHNAKGRMRFKIANGRNNRSCKPIFYDCSFAFDLTHCYCVQVGLFLSVIFSLCQPEGGFKPSTSGSAAKCSTTVPRRLKLVLSVSENLNIYLARLKPISSEVTAVYFCEIFSLLS